jgi:uncharacterized protein with PQ loop repeat
MENEVYAQRAEIVSSFAIVILAILAGWSLHRQRLRIWKSKSGASISVSWMLYFCFLSWVYFVYGWATDKTPMIFHGLIRGVFHVPILIGLWKFKSYTRKEKGLVWVLFFLLALMIVIPWRNYLFLLLSSFGVVSMFLQPWEMVRESFPYHPWFESHALER